MCGICGILAPDRDAADLGDRVRRMCAALVHRGPDDEGVFVEHGFAVGARRLSIVDLTHGHQPFVTPDAAGVAAMNGEIYNFVELLKCERDQGYAFTSRCDTEVMLSVLQRRGTAGIPDLRGIFALAHWHRQTHTLTLARDALGVKPLYVYQPGPGQLVFGSELKALLASGLVPGTPDVRALTAFLTTAYIPGHGSPIADVRMLPPGTWLTVAPEHTKEHRYWRAPDPESTVDTSSYVDVLRAAIGTAVSSQLTGDVPIGLLLSAGLDSSLVLKKMTDHYPGPIHTFTARFDDQRFDEGDVAAGTAQGAGTEHHEVHCSAQDLAAIFPEVTAATDGLIANTAAVPIYLVCRAAAKYLKVVLSGLGGDEVFFGYPTYRADRLATWLRPVPEVVLGLCRVIVGMLPVSHGKVPFDYKLRKFFEGVKLQPEKAHYWWRTIFTDHDRRELLSLTGDDDDPAWHAFENAFQLSSAPDFLHRAAVCDLETWLACMALPMNDGCSMAHGLEMRVPLLDQKLVETVYRLPRQYRYRWRQKQLLRRICAPELRPEVMQQPKQGFHIPLAGWLCGPLREFMTERLTDRTLQDLGVCPSETVTRLIREHTDRHADHSFRLWNLMVLAQWADTFL